MEQKNNKYYSYISEYYAANPTKFEKRKNNLKPVLYFCLLYTSDAADEL